MHRFDPDILHGSRAGESAAFLKSYAAIYRGVIHCLSDEERRTSEPEVPATGFNTELPGVLRIQPLPAEPHRLTTCDAADGSSTV